MEQILGMVGMRNVKIKVRYKGTNYCGWQSQKNGVAIQDVLKAAIDKITGEDVKLIGAGRTDAGVHAMAQVANFVTGSSIPAERFPHALNAVLPDDISVFHAEEVDMNFNARYDAIGKHYRYYIWNSRFRPGLFKEYCYWCPYQLNMELMHTASKLFVGTHDFKNYMSTGGSAKTTIRNLWSVEVGRESDIIYIDIKGNGFLYNMVRRIAGCLVEVGRRKKTVQEVKDMVEGKNTPASYLTLPSKGLFLMEVYY